MNTDSENSVNSVISNPSSYGLTKASKVAGTNYIYMGTGMSFAVSSYYDDWKNLTSSDFVVYAVQGYHYTDSTQDSGWAGSSGGGNKSLAMTYTYNSATGLLTVNSTSVNLGAYGYDNSMTLNNAAAFIKVPN